MGQASAGGGALQPVGLIGAMPEELALLLARAETVSRQRLGPFELVSGMLDGLPVLMATCGIGKVNAAALTQALASAGVRSVVVTGVAGGVDPDLRVGDLVVSRDAVQHDVDVTGLGYSPGEVPGEPQVWTADVGLREAAFAAASEVADRDGVRVLVGRVASGDVFVADAAAAARLRAAFGASCAEMEGAAVAQVCHRWGLPWVVVRSISDTADHGAQVDFRTFTQVAAERAVAVVVGTLQRFRQRAA